MPALASSPAAAPARIRLAGSVAGLGSCELVTDRPRITVGSALASDLCLADPLVPPRALTLRWTPATGWLLAAAPGARVYVNDHLTQRDQLALGDTIAVGCHRLVFGLAADRPRNFRSTTTVDDVCGRLLSAEVMPIGFLHGTPQWMARRRLQAASRVALGLLVAMVLLFWLTPRETIFEQVQPPLDVVMIAEQAVTPQPTLVRAMNEVTRKTVKVTDEVAEPQLAPAEPPTVVPPEVPETQAMPELANVRAPAPVSPTVVSAAGTLAPLDIEDPTGARLAVTRPAQKIAHNAPVRRLSLKEATDPVFTRELANHQIQIAPEALRAVAAVRMTGRAAVPTRAPLTNLALRADPTKLAALMKYEPSPLTFDKVSGHRVPVARLPVKLGELEVKGADKAITLDGTVSESEIAVSWKSGQFRLDAPGDPPPAGNPPTYCYVGQAVLDGKPHLYISFVCLDPNVSGIRDSYNGVWQAATTITDDDEIEIFLDTNFDRTDYHQLIVNTSGKSWGQYCRSFRDDGIGARWDPAPRIKTSVSRETGRWSCEVMIPFDQLGGVPAKGSRWSVNFYRSYRGQKAAGFQLQNWFLVYDPTPGGVGHYYHNPAKFGVFQW